MHFEEPFIAERNPSNVCDPRLHRWVVGELTLGSLHQVKQTFARNAHKLGVETETGPHAVVGGLPVEHHQV